MIEINLLPPDLKPSEGTPPKRFGLYVLFVASAAALIFFVLSFYQVTIPKLNGEIQTTNTEITDEKKKKDVVDKTQKAIDDLKQKVAAFDNLNNGRVRLARVLDALCTAVSSPETEGVWLKTMSIMPDNSSRGAAAGPGQAVGKKYTIALRGMATGTNQDDAKKRYSRLLSNLNTEFKIPQGAAPNPAPENWGFNEKLKVRFEPPAMKSFTVGPVPKPTITRPKEEGTLASTGPAGKEDAAYEKAVLELLKPPTEGLDFVMDLKFELPPPQKPPEPAPTERKKKRE